MNYIKIYIQKNIKYTLEGRNMFSKDKKNKTKNEIEDATKYGEFVSSYFGWMTLEEQKKKAKDLENMTKNRD